MNNQNRVRLVGNEPLIGETFLVHIYHIPNRYATKSTPKTLFCCANSRRNHPSFYLTLNKLPCFLTFPSKHFSKELISKVIDHSIWADCYDKDIMRFALLNKLVVINLRFISE